MKVISILSSIVIVIAIACASFIGGYMYHSYRLAVDTLEYCTYENGDPCHMVREGLEFNVYWMEGWNE